MNKLTSVTFASVVTIATVLSVSSTAFAWHPKGQISKTVQNTTTNSAVGENVTAKPGDVLKYTVTVSNVAAPAEKQYNDMAFTVMTDSLPAGVELVDNAANRTIREDMGLILPGKSVTKTYAVKVTSTTKGAVIENKACYTADSVVKDNPQKGCDTAKVTVDVPTAPVTPVQIETPTTPVTPAVVTGGGEQPATLVATGVGSNVAIIALLAAFAGYVGRMTILKRRAY